MQEKNKQVSIQVKVDKRIADQLHRRAKEKEIIFSKYVKRVLTSEAEKKEEQK